MSNDRSKDQGEQIMTDPLYDAIARAKAHELQLVTFKTLRKIINDAHEKGVIDKLLHNSVLFVTAKKPCDEITLTYSRMIVGVLVDWILDNYAKDDEEGKADFVDSILSTIAKGEQQYKAMFESENGRPS